MQILWDRPVSHSSNLLGINLKSIPGNNVTQVQNLCHVKVAFANLCIEAVIPEDDEDFPKVNQMLLRSLTKDEDIIQVNDHMFVKLLTEQAVHNLLKGTRGIAKAEAHNSEFIMPKWCSEPCFLNIFISNGDLMVALSQVKPKEDMGALLNNLKACQQLAQGQARDFESAAVIKIVCPGYWSFFCRQADSGHAAADLPEDEAAARFAQAAVALKRKDAEDRAAVQVGWAWSAGFLHMQNALRSSSC